ncbi:MAG: Spy/CpxP family protein refolding chaperone [Phenylobacterium sp.]|uniref:Spy/CpxP family protein refolding chaperone n=1 Tax=Phenylobacterium sp. TaxID=1871053 RepID=UPI001A5946AD|nr:Spy/CpxP family protein refolding chaperone [Phenylobacterium sp.]MBL8554428.1 Spy/CpxP family protein refolding chaperone [Phenylobacterium sp.]
MTRTKTWLLAGAALALCAGAAVAAIDPEDAARQAEADARAAAADAHGAIRDSRDAAREARDRAREAREDAQDRARDAADRAREAGERAREAAERARDAAREATLAVRRDGDFVSVSRGMDREDYLADVLRLRPDQKPALAAFLDATKTTGRHDAMVRFDHDRDAARSTLQRLDDMQSRMAAQQADANRRIAAIRAFYGQLDAGQKKAFDGMPMLMMVGPSVGPMLIPARIPIAHVPPAPPLPPVPPMPRL